jgi:hypothetical protein
MKNVNLKNRLCNLRLGRQSEQSLLRVVLCCETDPGALIF